MQYIKDIAAWLSDDGTAVPKHVAVGTVLYTAL